MEEIDFVDRGWPPESRKTAASFLAEARPTVAQQTPAAFESRAGPLAATSPPATEVQAAEVSPPQTEVEPAASQVVELERLQAELKAKLESSRNALPSI